MRIRRAVISVYDKTDIVEFAQALVGLGAEIISTGGTARHLEEADIATTSIKEATGEDEIFGGRVKTFPLMGQILKRRGHPDDEKEAAARGIGEVDMVVCNLYAFADAIANPNLNEDACIEMIDIGGPTMIRGAAKNWKDVVVIVDRRDYPLVIEEIRKTGEVSRRTARRLSAKVFRLTAAYDAVIAQWMGSDEEFPEQITLSGTKLQGLRYGENPHQRAAWYRMGSDGFGDAVQHQGKELSFNNLVDLDAAVRLAYDLGGCSAVIVKHTNPCGVFRFDGSDNLAQAYRMAREVDPQSAFGGVVVFPRPVDMATAEELTSSFIEVVLAPSFESQALAVLKRKSDLRVIEMPFMWREHLTFRHILGGVLVQTPDHLIGPTKWDVVTQRKPTDAEQRALNLAWIIAKHAKSNNIAYTSEDQLLGLCPGQMSRVESARIGRERFRADAVRHSRVIAAASEAFFPFRDGVDEIARSGATAIIQPGGSKRDEEVIAAANEHGLAMVFAGDRHFRH